MTETERTDKAIIALMEMEQYYNGYFKALDKVGQSKKFNRFRQIEFTDMAVDFAEIVLDLLGLPAEAGVVDNDKGVILPDENGNLFCRDNWYFEFSDVIEAGEDFAGYIRCLRKEIDEINKGGEVKLHDD